MPLGSLAVIPDEFRDGAGVFPGYSLACDLLEPDGCCLEFGEDLCAAAPRRPTLAYAQLERNEHFRVALGGPDTKATLTSPGDQAVVPMHGSAGYGFADGDAPRTFYLGSLELWGGSTWQLEDTCPDQSQFSVQVDLLALILIQPAFGIHSDDLDVGFPPGGLHLLAYVYIDGHLHTLTGVNQAPVTGLVRGSDEFEASNLVFEFALPCGDSELPVVATFELERTSTEESPPTATITTPASVDCQSEVLLTADVADPDEDIAEVRWLVDDVLLDESVQRVKFYQDAVLKLRVRDERGATTIRSQTMSCL